MEKSMIRALLLFVILMFPGSASAFCGFYVSKADSSLFNQASKVVLARNDDKTVITMANDFKGDVSEFAIVIPVPQIIEQTQVNVTENRIIDHLDAYTAPRLVEYFDQNPCAPVYEMMTMSRNLPAGAMDEGAGRSGAAALGVTIEREYTVGEYDILILSAKQSDGLLTWLNQENYKLPDAAEKILKSYIKQDMKFFVAKVNLAEHEQSGFSYLRPLQVAYESSKFMLPIRLGTLNANGPQDIIIMTLTMNGRVETTNYRTVKIPTDINVPLFIEDEFATFYQALFEREVGKENMKTVFLEYAWDMNWCDPCAADPLPAEDLRTLGAFWVEKQDNDRPGIMNRRPVIMPPPVKAVNVFVTRLHARYDMESFPEDLMFNETNDRQNFQGRFIMQHPYKGQAECEAAKKYYNELPARFEKEAQELARVTGWSINEIRQKMEETGQSFKPGPFIDDRPWWEQMWDQ
jgi:hypothetical protein